MKRIFSPALKIFDNMLLKELFMLNSFILKAEYCYPLLNLKFIERVSEFFKMNASKGNCIEALYLELRKVFDSVHNGFLLEKMPYHGITDKD